MSPVHAGLFAAPDDDDSGGGLYMPGGDEQARFPEFSVAHVRFALTQVIDLFLSFAGFSQGRCMPSFNSLDDGGGPDPVEQAFEETVLFCQGLGVRLKLFATGVEVVAGVHEVVRENRIGECVAEGLFKCLLPVGDALHPDDLSVPSGQPQLADKHGCLADRVAADRIGERSAKWQRASLLVKPLIFAEYGHPDLPCAGLAVLALDPGGVRLRAGRSGAIEHAEKGAYGLGLAVFWFVCGIRAHIRRRHVLLTQAMLAVLESQCPEFGNGDGDAAEACEHVAALGKGTAQDRAAHRPVTGGGGTSGHDPERREKRRGPGPDVGVAHGDPSDAGEHQPRPVAMRTLCPA